MLPPSSIRSAGAEGRTPSDEDDARLRGITAWLGDLMCRPEEPLIGHFGNSLSVEGAKRLNVLMSEPDNDTLRRLGAFDRKCKVDKHTATHWGYLRDLIAALGDAGQREAADVLIWQVWHRVNSVARAHEYYRISCDEKTKVQRENERLRKALTGLVASLESDIIPVPPKVEAAYEAAASCLDDLALAEGRPASSGEA